ncbi:butyrophilin subfamily 1 member A1-like isoform X34 [Apteryx mantelli]|uniref:Butyrophilin subfamily 1 member A1-like isoform X34 n=1 Tax=Apteryx mantelli TaxID=2696672 RepID=A0ABM4FXY9_9AVES
MRFLLGSGCSSLANHPWGVLCYLVTLHVLHLGSAQLKVVGPGHAVTATVGQSIVLPCQISPSLNAQSMAVRWIRHHIAETVHQYEDGEDLYVEQMREYQGRTVLSHDGLSRGSLDLQIVSVRPSDDGTYICTVEGAAGYAEATVELEVAAIGSSPLVSLEGYQGGGIQVVCRSSGWFPEPEVLWKDLQGQRLPSVSQRHSHDERGLFEIEHSLSVTGEADGDLSCVVRNSRLGQEKESSLHISAPFFHDAQPWKVALAVMLVALLVLIPGLILFSVRLFKKREQQSSDLEEKSRGLGKVFIFLEEESRGLEKLSRGLGEQSRDLEKLSRGLEEQSRDLGKVLILQKEQSRDLGKQSSVLEEQSSVLGKLFSFLGKLYSVLGEQSRDLEEQSSVLETVFSFLGKQSRDLGEQSRDLVELSSVMEQLSRGLEEQSRDLGKVFIFLEERSRDLEKLSRGLEEQSRDLGKQSRFLEEQSIFLEEGSRDLGKQSRDLEAKTMELREQAAELAWRRLVLPIYKEEVSLDPDTAHPQLILSEDCRSVRWGETRQNLPNSHKRFNSSLCVLGREVFTAGRHWWEVEVQVGAEPHWAVGVARESLRRKGPIKLSPDKGIWAVQYWKGKFEALTSPPTPLSLSPVPKRIWVCLDCTGGQVTFVSADNGAEIYTFQSFPLVWGRIRPWFCVEKGAVWLGPSNSTPHTHAPHPTSSPASEASCPSPDAPSAPLLAPAAADGQLSSAQTQGAGSG